MKKKMKNIICIICTLSVACTLYLWLPGLAPEVNAKGTGISEGDWEMSDEKLEGSGYRFELSYQRLDGSVAYIYMTPLPDKKPFQTKSGIGIYLNGNYYSYVECEGLKVSIQGGTCHVNADGCSFVTNVFFLEELG